MSIKNLIDPSMSNWCHHSPYILKQGRAVWWSPAKEEEEEEVADVSWFNFNFFLCSFRYFLLTIRCFIVCLMRQFNYVGRSWRRRGRSRRKSRRNGWEGDRTASFNSSIRRCYYWLSDAMDCPTIVILSIRYCGGFSQVKRLAWSICICRWKVRGYYVLNILCLLQQTIP